MNSGRRWIGWEVICGTPSHRSSGVYDAQRAAGERDVCKPCACKPSSRGRRALLLDDVYTDADHCRDEEETKSASACVYHESAPRVDVHRRSVPQFGSYYQYCDVRFTRLLRRCAMRQTRNTVVAGPCDVPATRERCFSPRRPRPGRGRGVVARARARAHTRRSTAPRGKYAGEWGAGRTDRKKRRRRIRELMRRSVS